jgi:hypothetical protein
MWGVSLLLTLVDCRWRAAGSTVRTLVLLWTAWVVFLLIALPLGRSHERQHERNGLCHANPI